MRDNVDFGRRARSHPRPKLDGADQSGLMPASLITLAHFSVSSAMNFPNSAGEPPNTVAPRSANRAFSLGSPRLALISLLSLSMISAGVFLGAPTLSPHSRARTRQPTAHP